MDKSKIILFYKFIKIDNPEKLAESQRELCLRLGLKGRVIIAGEGINATLEGHPQFIDKYKKELVKDKKFKDVVFKESEGNFLAFPKLAVKVRDEVVTLKAGKFTAKDKTADFVSSEELESWYKNNEDFVVLDLRNSYEISTGKFEKTVDPGLRHFRDLNDKLPELENLKDKKVISVCTGGIRCEKATKLLKKKGFKNIYQLQDGIHTYMKKYPGSHFKGTLFVFDNRMITDVTNIANKEIVGECRYCGTKTEKYYSDDTVRPSAKILCCDNCIQQYRSVLREVVTY